jgi:hypothetical protein
LQETSRYLAGARHHPQDEEPRDKSTVAGGLGLSMIVQKHLLDYFEQRWGEQPEGKWERVAERKQAELNGTRAKLETATKKEAKALHCQLPSNACKITLQVLPRGVQFA